MNTTKLQQAEHEFLHRYPGGFLHPDMQAIGKKHKMDAMIAFANDHFKKSHFRQPQDIAENMIKMISRSSMVSMFEKPKFRDFVHSLNDKETRKLSNALKNQLHGDQKKGFNDLLTLLQGQKLAKWSLTTIIPNYFYPNEEVFVKPTTAKNVIAHFELQGLEYKPAPSWDFYQKYKQAIHTMKQKVDSTLTSTNAAFCGFLMMTCGR
ncbi:hypothetical protein [Pleionea sp. CnH1-48]|uniref:hypothetical protein n=1 Tax=Pleionea sp. CnH1-48 TaxID=2954494 RepID=UPI0020983952|nr:hypothetical protein [Pleionea sp. CnH1-48]MCO7222850.1 hypothetical protein [Pleionea sp. CnH1-48]